MRGSSARPVGLVPFTLILRFLLITHHSAPHKKVTVVKDGHVFTQDLIKLRSRALAASEAPESEGVGKGKERSRDACAISGEHI